MKRISIFNRKEVALADRPVEELVDELQCAGTPVFMVCSAARNTWSASIKLNNTLGAEIEVEVTHNEKQQGFGQTVRLLHLKVARVMAKAGCTFG